MFVPLNREYGRPKVGLGAVGPEMTRVAAEVADALLCHSFTSPKYLREVTLPAVESVLAAHGRARKDFRIIGMPFFACGETDQELEKAMAGARRRIAFYASTPAYAQVLACHGFEGVQPEMLRLSKLGEWEAMGRLVSDDMLNAYVITGSAAHCARELQRRYDGIFDMACGYTDEDPGMPRAVLEALVGNRDSSVGPAG
ncbi:MAG: hypothetical protein RL367_1384 [Pseudomonadota bacterium]